MENEGNKEILSRVQVTLHVGWSVCPMSIHLSVDLSVCPSVRPSICQSVWLSICLIYCWVIVFLSFLRSVMFLGSGPKGPMSCGTQEGNFKMIVLPSPPPWLSEPQVCSLRPDFGPLSPQISPFRPQFSPRELKSALHTSYLPSRPKISPPDLKSALQASN